MWAFNESEDFDRRMRTGILSNVARSLTASSVRRRLRDTLMHGSSMTTQAEVRSKHPVRTKDMFQLPVTSSSQPEMVTQYGLYKNLQCLIKFCKSLFYYFINSPVQIFYNKILFYNFFNFIKLVVTYKFLAYIMFIYFSCSPMDGWLTPLPTARPRDTSPNAAVKSFIPTTSMMSTEINDMKLPGNMPMIAEYTAKK